jgi:hypothetical protein
MELRSYRGVFLVASLYDLVLGVVFLFLYPWLYGLLGIAPPTEPAYLQASAAFVLVQGIMYLFVYRNMIRNRDLVTVGAIYKAAYASVAFYHWGLGDLPHSVFAVLGLLDVGFLILFVMFLRKIGTGGGESLTIEYTSIR